MKTFTVSAIAFYAFYVLNGLMAPGHASRTQEINCADPSMHEAASKAGAAGSCKRDTLMASRNVTSN